MNVSRYQRAVRLGAISIALSFVNVLFMVCFLSGMSDALIAYSLFLTIVIVVLSGVSVCYARTGPALAILMIHILILAGYGVIIYLFRDFCVIC